MVDPVQLFPGFRLADPSYVVTDLLICVFSFCGGVNAPGDIEGNAKLQEAFRTEKQI